MAKEPRARAARTREPGAAGSDEGRPPLRRHAAAAGAGRRALLADPPLLLLDEPTASLDVESRRDLQQLILRLRDQGKAVILSTHFLDHLDEVADRALILHEGRLAFDGSLDELSQRARGNRYVVNLNGNAPARVPRGAEGRGRRPRERAAG